MSDDQRKYYFVIQRRFFVLGIIIFLFLVGMSHRFIVKHF